VCGSDGPVHWYVRELSKFNNSFDKPRQHMSKKLIMKVSFDNFIQFRDISFKMNCQFDDVA
jgi:hypothetical protein